LKQAINSIENQSFDIRRMEVCIHDDGSSSEYKLLYENWLKKRQSNLKIKWSTSSKNMGPAYAKNIAASLGDGEFYILLDSDDILHPDAISTSIKILEKDPKAELVYSDNIKFQWPSLEPFQFRKKSLYQIYAKNYKGTVFDPVIQSSFIVGIQAFRKDTFEYLNGFDNTLLVGEDIKFM